MLEMLKARKEELQAQGKKGFTLMEMLIVIAIIAVLIAIAIPVFTSQLADAEKAVDEANARSGYAYIQSMALTDSTNYGAGSYILQNDGTAKKSDDSNNAYVAKQAADASVSVGGLKPEWTKGGSIIYTVDNNKKVTKVASS